MNKKQTGPRRIVILNEGTRGHMHQSLGIARWLQRLCGADIREIEVPRLSGLKRFRMLKLQARHLTDASPEELKEWLNRPLGNLQNVKTCPICGKRVTTEGLLSYPMKYRVYCGCLTSDVRETQEEAYENWEREVSKRIGKTLEDEG